MNIKEIKNLPVGSKVYRVRNGNIEPFTYTGPHPNHPLYLGMTSHGNVADATNIYTENNNEFWTDNYDSAKEKMWEQFQYKVEATLDIYFKDSHKVYFTDVIHPDSPWPLSEVLGKLIEASEIMLQTPGYPERLKSLDQAVDRAKQIKDALERKKIIR